MRFLVPIAVMLAVILIPALASAGSQEAGSRCPSGGVGRDFDGLLVCVPKDNQRYSLTQDGIDWMAWQGDDPIALPGTDQPATGEALQMTLARVWIGEFVVGASDSVNGREGFDRFMSLIAANILNGADGASSTDGFAAVVPLDESGLSQRFQFRPIHPDLLQGEPADKQESGVDFILFRPSSGTERPHILLCSGGKSIQNPTHICMGIRDMDGHRVGITVTGTKLERSFRISEEIGSELESFVIRQAP